MSRKNNGNVMLTLLALSAMLIMAPGAFAQDQGGDTQDDQKQDQKQDDQKQDDEKQEVDVNALMGEATQLMGQGDFEKAADAFKKVTEAAADNARAWHLYGYCVHALGKIDEALPIHEKAVAAAEKMPDSPQKSTLLGISLYNLGCAHALKENAEKALENLGKAADTGWTSAAVMQDTDLTSLHDNEEFKKIAARLMGQDTDGDGDDGDGDDGDGGDGDGGDGDDGDAGKGDGGDK